jgi:hypothetical protein
LSNWLINAFNGEWLKVANAMPVQAVSKVKERRSGAEELRAGVEEIRRRSSAKTDGSHIFPLP